MTTARGSTGDALTDILVPEPALRAWIGDRLPGSGPYTIRRMTAGLSNELFELARGGGRWVLRRPPRVPLAPTAHDMGREVRVLRALAGSRVPHPEVVLFCSDESVIGAPFYVMPLLDGVSITTSLPENFDNEADRRRIGAELVDALAGLHTLDWRQLGLEDFGRPDGYAARQVARWMNQWSRYKVRELPELEAVASWLDRHTPTETGASLIHCDFGLHNVLFARTSPARLLAVLDWETSTIGDPLCDFGHFVGSWIQGDDRDRWFGSRVAVDLTKLPTRDWLVNRYATLTGRSMDHLTWYRALGQLRIAVILEGNYARHVAGHGDRAISATLETRVPNIAQYAAAIVAGEA